MPRITETREISLSKEELVKFLKLKPGEEVKKIFVQNLLSENSEEWIRFTTERRLEQISYEQ